MEHTYFVEEYKTLVPARIDLWKVAFPVKVIKRLVRDYSKRGDVVFDPFAGFGTTILVSTQLGRQAFGTEIDNNKIKFAKNKLKIELIGKSAFDLNYEKYPRIDLCIFSPPYWGPALGVKSYKYARGVGLT